MTSVESLLKGCNRTVTGRDQIEYGLMGAYTTATPAVTSASRQVCCCGKGVGKGREAPSCITLQGKKCASACRSLPATPPTLLVWTLHPLHWCLSLDFGTAKGHKFTRCQPHFQQLLECSLCCVSPAAFCLRLQELENKLDFVMTLFLVALLCTDSYWLAHTAWIQSKQPNKLEMQFRL